MIRIKDNKKLLKRISILLCFMIVIGFINSSSNSVQAGLPTEPSFTVEIDPVTPNPAMIGEDITVTGKIKPQAFETTTPKKQIVLVLDVSGSMNLVCTNTKIKKELTKTQYDQLMIEGVQGLERINKGTSRHPDYHYYVEDYCEEHNKIGEHSDTDGKIDQLKIAANNFITKMSNVPNMEIAIVAYSSEAIINPTLNKSTTWNGLYNDTKYDIRQSKSITANSSHSIPDYKSSGSTFVPMDTTANITKLQGMITNLEALGGTNTGEGLRKAEYMLEHGDATANKSIVFMSDGEPTFYSVNNNTTYKTIDNTNPNYSGTGSGYDEKSKGYAIEIGTIIKNSNPNVFSIGYGLGTETSDGNLTMKAIHESMGGTTGTDGTFFATDAGAIDGVFNKIADKIIAQYTLTDVKINLQPDLNFSFNGGGYVVNISNINYIGVTQANGNTLYSASDVPFTFTIKGNMQGDYNNIFQETKLTVPWNGKEIITAIPTVGVVIKDNVLPVINANIVSQTPDPAIQSQDITLKYAVKPEIFEFNSTTFDELEPKDVIFVVDTSSSMNDKLSSLKNALYGKIANNTAIKNAQYGIVTFDSTVKNNYISTGLTNNATTFNLAIQPITSSNNTNRNIGDAMIAAKTIFSNSGRSNSSKYIVLIASGYVNYTEAQLNDIKNSNLNVITINLGGISPITKNGNIVTPGADEANNNIKEFHYNLIGKEDNGDNVLEKVENNYFININYSLVTNASNPNEFFTKEANMNQMNNSNEINNWILPLVANKIRMGTVQLVPSYIFKTKLKFNLQGKFDSILGFNTCSDVGYDVETPEFNVKYNLENGKYVPEPIEDRVFTIKIKAGINTTNLAFGSGIVSYTNLANTLTKVNINPYNLKFRLPMEILKHGVYEGIINKMPSIIDGSATLFNFAKGSNVTLAATMAGSINNDTGVRLEVPKEVEINGTIKVFTYEDNGTLTEIGIMGTPSSDATKTTYIYDGQAVVDQKILIVYSEKLPQDPTKEKYTNSLYIPGSQRDVNINVSSELPDLF